ncbi:MAG TPA: class I SAM-dependent methyltransferase [Candidatus Binatus sp.]|nr:class I SAM-dependent methyltransferase [Candidatus Binatus sp.]
MTDSSAPPPISVLETAWQWWTYAARYEGYLRATRRLLGVLWEFARDSTPERRRLRFGDADYDWDFRVNTTSGAVGWRDRLLGTFHSEYQPTEPAVFHEMLDSLQQKLQLTTTPDHSTLTFRDFTFIDLGSGKGRTLLMASDYPFRRIVGVELLHSLHQIAQENLRLYKREPQKCFALESVCTDATAFVFPNDPLVLYLFNPFPESSMRQVLANLEQSLRTHPRPVFVLYHNPLLEHVLSQGALLRKIVGAHQYSLFSTQG